MNYLLTIFISVLLAAVQPIFLKKYYYNGNIFFVIVAVLAAMMLTYFYYDMIKHTEIGVGYTLIKILAILLVALAGIIYFGESVNIKKILGILFAIVTIILLS